jgi:hypothetical protein
MSISNDLIQAERSRHLSVEGWTATHDDEHDGNEMYDAAICYIWFGTEKAAPLRSDGTPEGWPWEAQWWKPRDRLKNLVRAGSLLVAEKDRRSRAKIDLGDIEDLLKRVEKEIELLAA